MVAASIGLGLFAFRRVEYSTNCGGSSRRTPMRHASCAPLSASSSPCCSSASVNCCGRRRPVVALPDADELDAATRVIARQGRTLPNLVFLRDKALLWDETRTAFMMYAVQGRTWVALGDPRRAPRKRLNRWSRRSSSAATTTRACPCSTRPRSSGCTSTPISASRSPSLARRRVFPAALRDRGKRPQEAPDHDEPHRERRAASSASSIRLQ